MHHLLQVKCNNTFKNFFELDLIIGLILYTASAHYFTVSERLLTPIISFITLMN